MKSMSRLGKNEQGMVSILVTLIMIIVITLIVLGFSQITRNNQRQALDNQLSTQAYYAAESGVNAAVNYLTDPVHVGTGFNTVGNCSTFINTLTTSGLSNTLDTNTNTKYTCLMVNTQPPDLELSPLTQASSSILHLANTDGEPFTALNFKWQMQSSPNFPASTCNGSGPSGGSLPTYTSWNCPFGLLRLDLVDTSSAHLDSNDLQNSKYNTSFYLVPSYRSGSPFTQTQNVKWPPATQPVDPTAPANPACNSANDNCPVQIVPVKCTSGVNANCSLTLNIASGSTDYYARLSMMYQDSSQLVIRGGDLTHPLNLITGQGVHFSTGQALIDSTGQSEDELRRVQVRIPLAATSGSIPAYGLQSTDSICKQLSDGPSISTQDSCPGHP